MIKRILGGNLNGYNNTIYTTTTSGGNTYKTGINDGYTDAMLEAFAAYGWGLNLGLGTDALYDFSNTTDPRAKLNSPDSTLATLIAERITYITDMGVPVWVMLDQPFGYGLYLPTAQPLSPATPPSNVVPLSSLQCSPVPRSLSAGWRQASLTPFFFTGATTGPSSGWVKYDPITMHDGFIGMTSTNYGTLSPYGVYPLIHRGCWNYDAGRYCNAGDIGSTINVGKTYTNGMTVTSAHLPTTEAMYDAYFGDAFTVLDASPVMGYTFEEGYDNGLLYLNDAGYERGNKPVMQYLAPDNLRNSVTDQYGWFVSHVHTETGQTALQWMEWLVTQADVMYEMYLGNELTSYTNFPDPSGTPNVTYPTWPSFMQNYAPTKKLGLTTQVVPPGTDGINDYDGAAWWGTTVSKQQKKACATGLVSILSTLDVIETIYHNSTTPGWGLDDILQCFNSICVGCNPYKYY